MATYRSNGEYGSTCMEHKVYVELLRMFILPRAHCDPLHFLWGPVGALDFSLKDDRKAGYFSASL
jgi:hypothetical protein